MSPNIADRGMRESAGGVQSDDGLFTTVRCARTVGHQPGALQCEHRLCSLNFFCGSSGGCGCGGDCVSVSIYLSIHLSIYL